MHIYPVSPLIYPADKFYLATPKCRNKCLLLGKALCFLFKLYYLERTGEQGLIDEAQKALEEAEALKKVIHLFYFIIDLFMKVIVICRHGSKSKDLPFCFNHSFLPGRSQHWILQSIQLLMFGL
jgi:hypothetical protein